MAEHGYGTTALDVRPVGREVRREDQDRIAGIEKRLAEELLEHLGARADDNVLGRNVHAELAAVVSRRRLPEGGHARRGTVMRGAGVDRLHAGGKSGAAAGKRAVADLQFDDILAARFQSPGDRQNVEGCLAAKTVGEVTELYR